MSPIEFDPLKIAKREKLILTGLYLSKYDSLGLKRLGFDSFIEACNVLGYALGGKPASIKNYRDEFDPLFPNRRKGWHKRERRSYCLNIYEEYKNMDLDSFTGLVKSFAGYDENALSQYQGQKKESSAESSQFAQRTITGLAAERYFELIFPKLSEFEGYLLKDTTKLGCGYDFRLAKKSSEDFLAVEVKGLRGSTGGLAMTPREHLLASNLRERYFLFVVRNFRESPFHELYQDPLFGELHFAKVERVTLQVSWVARL